MPSHNRVELIGNVSIDPKIHTFPSGDLQVKFSLATNEEWQDKRSGDMVKRTDFHNIVVDNQPAAKFAQDFVKKGDMVAVFGQLERPGDPIPVEGEPQADPDRAPARTRVPPGEPPGGSSTAASCRRQVTRRGVGFGPSG